LVFQVPNSFGGMYAHATSFRAHVRGARTAGKDSILELIPTATGKSHLIRLIGEEEGNAGKPGYSFIDLALANGGKCKRMSIFESELSKTLTVPYPWMTIGDRTTS